LLFHRISSLSSGSVPVCAQSHDGSANASWGSRLGIILAVSGSAVGLGNFLRFPGNAAENGGGAFLIPYFIAFLLLGIPIGWAEWTMGRYGGRKGFHSAPAIIGLWGRGPVPRYLGSFGVLVPLVIYFYYVLIESWCLSYAWSYISGGLGIVPGQTVAEQVAASELYFNETTGANFDGLLVHGGLHPSVIFWGIAFALNIYFLYRGHQSGQRHRPGPVLVLTTWIPGAHREQGRKHRCQALWTGHVTATIRQRTASTPAAG
jgi:SNF family Na+-dependent transporter